MYIRCINICLVIDPHTQCNLNCWLLVNFHVTYYKCSYLLMFKLRITSYERLTYVNNVPSFKSNLIQQWWCSKSSKCFLFCAASTECIWSYGRIKQYPPDLWPVKQFLLCFISAPAAAHKRWSGFQNLEQSECDSQSGPFSFFSSSFVPAFFFFMEEVFVNMHRIIASCP